MKEATEENKRGDDFELKKAAFLVVSRPEEGFVASLMITDRQIGMTLRCGFPAIRLAETKDSQEWCWQGFRETSSLLACWGVGTCLVNVEGMLALAIINNRPFHSSSSSLLEAHSTHKRVKCVGHCNINSNRKHLALWNALCVMRSYAVDEEADRF